MAELTDRVTLIEIVWTAIALLGLGTCCWSLIDSLYDLLAMRSSKQDGLASIVVWINLRNGAAGVTLHLLFLVLGVAAMLTINPAQTLTGSLFAAGFILVAAHNTVTIFINQLARVQLRRRLGATPLMLRRP